MESLINNNTTKQEVDSTLAVILLILTRFIFKK